MTDDVDIPPTQLRPSLRVTPALWPVTGTIEPPTAAISKPVTHEDLDTYVKDVPLGTLRMLPPCEARDDAEAHIKKAAEIAHDIREKHKPE